MNREFLCGVLYPFHIIVRSTPLTSVGRRSYRRQIENALSCGFGILCGIGFAVGLSPVSAEESTVESTVPEASPVTEAPLVPAVLPGDGWTLDPEFSDEFNGETIDTTKWWDFNPAWPGRIPAMFARDNVTVQNGRLILTARVPREDELTVENVARGFDQFTTAIVKSKRRSFYGYYEARCRSMDAGVCNAFWLYDPLEPAKKYIEGEYSEEIDIFEIFGKPSTPSVVRTYYATVHRYQTPYVESVVNKKKYKLENHAFRQRVDFDFQADFHTYGMLWTPETITWYLDGKEMFTRKNDFFHRPLHIMIDCEIMRDWIGDPDPADLPASFETEYIHVWRNADENSIPMEK